MEKESDRANLAMAKNIRVRVGLIIYGLLFVSLFASEFLDSLFNNRLDSLGYDLAQRILFSFKPTVMALFLFEATGLYFLILRYLDPLLRFLTTGLDYQRARHAAVRIPWVVIIFQIVMWSIGVTLYYLMKGGQVDSGIPFGFGLALKIAVGLPASIYVSILFNIVLIPAKRRLRMVEMRENEHDFFSRHRDYFATLSSFLFVIIYYSYVVYYYKRSDGDISFGSLYAPLILLGLFFVAVSGGLIYLSKLEYNLQIGSILSVLSKMAEGGARPEERIFILNFNELGQLAGFVNTILDNFAAMIGRIHDAARQLAASSEDLSATGQGNAARSSQQAASTAEIVATMENLDRLSTDIGRQVRQVDELATQMKEGVNDGYGITKDSIAKMKAVTDSYSETIAGIRRLGEQISGIWEIVKIINGIAGQIRIIAFNAALEASSAGESGRNFEIVASEIRRLADNTVASINEIRTRIGDIQKASDALIESSESGTLSIQETWSLSRKLEQIFDTILGSSESSSESAIEMRSVVEQQIGAFEQILITSRQIAEGIHDFAHSVEESSETSDRLKALVGELNAIVGNFAERNRR